LLISYNFIRTYYLPSILYRRKLILLSYPDPTSIRTQLELPTSAFCSEPEPTTWLVLAITLLSYDSYPSPSDDPARTTLPFPNSPRTERDYTTQTSYPSLASDLVDKTITYYSYPSQIITCSWNSNSKCNVCFFACKIFFLILRWSRNKNKIRILWLFGSSTFH